MYANNQDGEFINSCLRAESPWMLKLREKSWLSSYFSYKLLMSGLFYSFFIDLLTFSEENSWMLNVLDKK